MTSNFSSSHSVFYKYAELFAIFVKFEIVVWKLFQFGKFKIFRLGKSYKKQKKNILGKGEIGAVTSIFFFFSHNVPKAVFPRIVNPFPNDQF